jgi:hypothetical protein
VSLSRYLLGVALLGIFTGSIAITARSVRRALLAAWSGAPAVLADIVIGFAITILLLEVLGALHVFRVIPVLLAVVACGVATVLWSRRAAGSASSLPQTGSERELSTPAPNDRASVIACVFVAALLCATWGTRTIGSLHDGMSTSVDTIWYHLPAAARFAQTGVVTDIHFFDNASLTAFYPASTPLLHALGIELLGTDLLSPILNFAFLAIALLAAWCIGRPFGVAPFTLVAVAAVVGTPMLATTQPGGGYNDIAGIAFFLSALALLATARREPHGWGIAGMRIAAVAAGLAVGTKYNFILPVAALSLGVCVLAAKGQRVRQTLEWTALVLLAGGFFYARNLVVVGNPVPPVSISIGPWSLPNPPSGVDEISPLSVLRQRSLWQSVFEPAFRDAFGPLWWLVLALVGAGLLCAIVTRRDAFARMLGMISAVSVLGYLVTPVSIGTKRFPTTFVYSLRYAACAAVLAAVALTISTIGRRYSRVVLLLFVAVLVATQFDPSIWPTDVRQRGFSAPVRDSIAIAAAVFGFVVLLAGAAVVVVRRRAPDWRPPLLAAIGVAVVVVVAGAVIHDMYVDNRNTESDYLPATYRWARTVRDERIGVVGTPLQYPLYGNDLSNHVQYVARRGRHGSNFPITTCRAWRRALTAGRYNYVVTAPNPLIPEAPPEALWTERDPAATVELRDGYATVFRLRGPLDPVGCNEFGPHASVRAVRT